MNTQTLTWRVYQCEQCPNVYKVSSKNDVIALAYPRPVSIDPATGQPCIGTCPAHRRKLSE